MAAISPVSPASACVASRAHSDTNTVPRRISLFEHVVEANADQLAERRAAATAGGVVDNDTAKRAEWAGRRRQFLENGICSTHPEGSRTKRNKIVRQAGLAHGPLRIKRVPAIAVVECHHGRQGRKR